MTSPAIARTVRAPRGAAITCKGWPQEAAMRMLMNNLDPDVAERPDDLVVYGGTGRAARSWAAFDAIVRTLKTLGDDETMLVQSGKPVAVFRTHPGAPRVLIANSNLVGKWATWEHFRDLEAKGLMMYGQMTAGSWIYIGTQGIVQGTFETFAEAARQRAGGDMAGQVLVTAGLGGMGGAQPLSVTMNGGVCLAVEVDRERIDRRLATGYCMEAVETLDEAIARVEAARKEKRAYSVAVHGNAAVILPELVMRGFEADYVTDQTSAHDELNGYVPHGMSYEQALRLRASDPKTYVKRSMESMAVHCRAMLEFQKRGATVFDYGNNLRGQAEKAGVANAFDYPGFVPAFIRPLFCQGKGPFRWVALSGDPEDIRATDEALLAAFPEDKVLARWLPLAAEHVHFQGLPARICWLGYGDRAKAGLIFNDLVKSGKREGADRHRTRSSRHRLGGEPLSRDGSDEGRQRRGRGLADPERVAQHGVRRDLGLVPPRRRRGHRLVAARGDGHRGGRHRGRRATARARAHQRSRHRCGAPRGRRVRGSDRGGEGQGCAHADGGGVVGG